MCEDDGYLSALNEDAGTELAALASAVAHLATELVEILRKTPNKDAQVAAVFEALTQLGHCLPMNNGIGANDLAGLAQNIPREYVEAYAATLNLRRKLEAIGTCDDKDKLLLDVWATLGFKPKPPKQPKNP